MIRLKSEIISLWGKLRLDGIPHLVSFSVAGGALGMILIGYFQPFYALPMLSEDGSFMSRDSFLTSYFKAAVLLITVLLLLGLPVFYLRGSQAGHLATRAFFLLFQVTLTFPTLLVIFDSEAIGDGAWLQQQHDTMTWLGGDIYRAHSERSLELGTGVNAQDPPLRLAVFKPPTGALGLERLDDWIWWFGYGPAWTQFAGKGWFLTSLGYVFLTLSFLGTHWRMNTPDARRLMKKLVVQAGLFFTVYFLCVSTLYAFCRSELRASEEATAQGAYQEGYERLRRATRLIPGLVNDTGIIYQLGYFQWQLEEEDAPEAKLYEIYALSENGYFERARTALNELWEALSEVEVPRYCSRELARQQVRIAVNEINSSKASSARAHLNKVLLREPNAIQALFHLQLVSLISGDLTAMRQANERLITLYRGFRAKNKRGVISTSHLMRSQGEAKGKNTVESWESRLRSKGQK